MIRRFLCVIIVALAPQAMPALAWGQVSSPTATATPTSLSTRNPTPTPTQIPTVTPTPTSTPAHPGVVTGVVFHDRDLDGVRDKGEEGLAGWEIDAGSSDNLNSGRTAFSDAEGAYRIEDVDSSLSNWQLDVFWPFETPVTHFYKVELPQPKPINFDQTSRRIDIPVAYDDDSAVTFRVWEDFDGDGAISAADELALYTDVVITDPSGAYVFETSGALTSLTLTGLLPGDYDAKAAVDPLTRAPFTVDKARNPREPVELLSKPQITFFGYAYEDSNRNGKYETGEPRLNAEVDAETRSADGGGGVGMQTEPDGSYVIPYGSPFLNKDVYVGCGNAPSLEPEGEDGSSSQGRWQGTTGMTYADQQLWFQDTPTHVDPGTYRYRVDCGLVWVTENPRQEPIVMPPPVTSDNIALPLSGTGDDENRWIPIWLALVVVASGAVLAGWAVRSKGCRPGRGRTGPRYR